MSVIDDALASMKERLEEIEREARQLRAAITAIENERSGPGRTSTRTPASARTPRIRAPQHQAQRAAGTAKRAPRGENRRQILEAIKTKAKTASEIEAETGIAAATAASTLHALVKAGHAKKATRGYVAV